MEARRWVENGDNLLRQAGVRGTVAGKPMPDAATGDAVLKALHGEGPVPAGFQNIVNDLKARMAVETADMLAADPSFAGRMIAGPDYFPRLWKAPKKTPTGPGSIGQKPFFFKGRTPFTYTELRNLGYEPVSANPYHMLALRRIAGTDYRDGLVVIGRLKKSGEAMPISQAPTEGWRIPKAGPAFQGKPYVDANGVARLTEATAVPNRIANELEQMFPQRPDSNIVRALDTAANTAKRAKLIGTLFQHIDFGMRAGAVTMGGVLRNPLTVANYPMFLTRAVTGQFLEGSRMAVRARLMSAAPIIKGSGVSMRMLVQEGLQAGGDTSILRRDIRSFLNEAVSGSNVGIRAKALDRAGAVNRFMDRGLFENLYPLAQEYAARNFVVPRIVSTHPQWTDAQIAGQAAKDLNIMFSNLGEWQSFFTQQGMKSLARRLIFSTNETESWIKAAVATAHGPSKRLWTEYWIGMGLFLGLLANGIHFATTGKSLPSDRYSPVDTDSRYGIAGVGYNPKFLAPDVPLKDENGENLTIDLMGQADTVFRFALEPVSAVTSRENVLLRAARTQLEGETFGGQKVEGAAQRAAVLVQDVALPIGGGPASQILRQKVPATEPYIPVSERRIGVAGQGIQASGVNLRSVRRDLELYQQYRDVASTLVPAELKDVWENYQEQPQGDRRDWLRRNVDAGNVSPDDAKDIIGIERRVAMEREKLRHENPILDAFLVETHRVDKPLTEAGEQALKRRRGQQTTTPPAAPAPQPVRPTAPVPSPTLPPGSLFERRRQRRQLAEAGAR